ncbi:hypothetical protein B9G55_21540 [Saccharibacillus sp. O16]|nr:hypothetical protein B9G55_21540 [Saccharibacillus sp. O16]
MTRQPPFFRCLIICLLFTCTAGSFAPERSEARDPEGLATWVWNPWLLRKSSDDLLRFAAANGIDTLYVQIDADMNVADYASFISRASAQNIRVYALDGAPRWALDRRMPEAFLSWLTTYQSSAAANERFAGIHIDAEPYLLPEWTGDQAKLLTSWKGTIGLLLDGAKRLNLRIEADMPFWFDEHVMPGEEGTLSAWMIGHFDRVTIMAYRDSAMQIADVSRNELAEAAKLGKTLQIAVETNPSSETPQITFYEEGASVLNHQLAALRTMVGDHPGFAGIAVHDYEGWKKLQAQASKAAASTSVKATSPQTSAGKAGKAGKSSQAAKASPAKSTTRKK